MGDDDDEGEGEGSGRNGYRSGHRTVVVEAGGDENGIEKDRETQRERKKLPLALWSRRFSITMPCVRRTEI